ncbi:MAG: Synerg-CTERM sorting domain-containing protein [Synergistes sp.]|nr:Synerg-CTERM sorting domain-containing protein [Synergistes sp.]
MSRKKIFTLLTIAVSLICLAAFAWAQISPTEVSTKDELIAAVNGAADNTPTTIVITKSIALGGASLDIPQSKDITLTLNKGVVLSTTASSDILFAVNSKGKLTVNGYGKIEAKNTGLGVTAAIGVMAVSPDKTGDVTVRGSVTLSAVGGAMTGAIMNGTDGEGGQTGNIMVADHAVLTATNENEEVAAWAIFNVATESCDIIGDVTVTGNAVLRAYGGGDAEFATCAILNAPANKDKPSRVTVAGDVMIEAYDSTSDAHCAIKGMEIDSGDCQVKILSGNFEGIVFVESNDGKVDKYAVKIHSGTFAHFNDAMSNDKKLWDMYKAPGCELTYLSNGKLAIVNCVAVSLDKDIANVPKSGDSVEVTAELIKNKDGSTVDIASMEILGAEGLPGLTVTPDNENHKIKVTNTGCEDGSYAIAVILSDNAGDIACATLGITIKDNSARPVKPTISGDELNENTVSADAQTYQDKEEAAAILPKDFTSEDIATDTAGNQTINPETAATLLGGNAKSSDISPLPITSADAGTDGVDKIIMTSYSVYDEFFGFSDTEQSKDPSKLSMYGITKDGSVKRLSYVAHVKDAKDGTFTVQNEDGTIATTIEKGKKYIISLFIADGKDCDLGNEKDGKIATATFLDKTGSGGNGGGGGGCNAGFAALALIALAFVPTRKKK